MGTTALWALNNGRAVRVTEQYRAERRDPIRIGRYAVNVLIVLIAGLIAVAVGNEIVIAHPDGKTSATLIFLLYGGSILFLLGYSWYLRVVAGDSPRLSLIGCVVLVLAGVAALVAPSYVALILVGAILVTLAVLDSQMSQS